MKKYLIFGLLISIILAILSPLASSFPDGLERVSEIFEFSHKGTTILYSPMPDYTVPFIKNENLSTIFAGIIGTILIFIILYLIGLYLRKKID